MRKKILLLAVSVLSITGCGYFEAETSGFIDPASSYQDEVGVNMALVGVYSTLSDLSFYGRDWFYAFNLQDDLSYYDRNYTKQELFLNNYTSTNATLNNLWENLYAGINRANSFLEYIQDSPVDKDLIRRTTAEVRFLRAYYYFILSSMWGDVPLRLRSSRDDNYELFQTESTPAADVFGFVVTEIEGIVDDLEDIKGVSDGSAGPGHITRSAARGILARIYLKMGGYPLNLGKECYEKAAFWAGKVKDSGLHRLNPDYRQVFINLAQDKYDETYRESIWEIEFKGNNQDGHTTGGCVGSYSGVYNNQADQFGFCYGYVSCTLKLFDLFESETDVRKDWNICTYFYRNGLKQERNLNSNQYVYCSAGKFRREYENSGNRSKDYTAINFPVLRYSDVLLMLAEAENEAYGGPTETAYDCLDLVRRRADPTCERAVGLSQEQFRKLIQDERGRELCFEGIRKPDLVRWGIYVEEMTKGRMAQVNDKRWHANKKFASYISDYTEEKHNWYPIPSKELATNSKIKQHPLW